MDARAFCPGHISTFFVPQREAGGRRRLRGSLGSGFSIEAGVSVKARCEGHSTRSGLPGLPFDLTVRDNGRPAPKAATTEAMLRHLVKRAPARFEFPRFLALDNAYNLPLGAGFGVSGGCALGGALAANAAMGLGASREECIAAAHWAEVEALTGLGDVPAQAVGGFEIRVRAGPPPEGEILTPELRKDPVVLVSFGPKPTREFLAGPGGGARVARAGRRALASLVEECTGPTLEDSIHQGRLFADALDLVSPHARALIDSLGPGVPSSIAMLGDSVFALGGARVESAVRKAEPRAFGLATRVAPRGARLL